MRIIKLLFIKHSGLTAVILISLIAVFNLVNFGIPPTHDGEYHIMRFWQFNKNISEGIFYPRWAPDFNNGYGVPLFNYVYPLPNYFAYLFNFLGFGLIESFKLNLAVATIVGAVFFYLWTRRYWGNIGAVVSSVFYTFSPYHLLDIYVRGSVGEVWSLAIFPGLLWSFDNSIAKKEKKYIALTSILLALLILAHNILATVFFVVFILYGIFILYINNGIKRLVPNLIIILFFGMGLSSPFWLPAILEAQYVSGLQIFDPTEHFPKLYQLIYSSWGYGFSGAKPLGAEGQMSFQIGIPNLIAIIIATIISFVRKDRISIFFIFLLSFLVFLITPFSGFIWKNVPFISYIQFPWRLLSVVILAASFLAGSLANYKFIKNKKKRLVIAIILISICIAFSIGYAKAPFYHKRHDNHYLTRSNFTDGTNSPGDLFNTKWLVQVPEKDKNLVNIQKGDAFINIIQRKTDKLRFEVNALNNSNLTVNIAYFPGWAVYVNGVKEYIFNKNGLIEIRLDKGKSDVLIKLKNTQIQTISYFIFIFSLLSLLSFVFYPAIIKKW